MTLAVIGAGFPRTGTYSLKLALEEIGFGPCNHAKTLMEQPERWQVWSDAAAGQPVDFDALLEGYRATTDSPSCHLYRRLADHFKDAKVILTERPVEVWYNSARMTLLNPDTRRLLGHHPRGREMSLTIGKLILGCINYAAHDERYIKDIYLAHNAEVKRMIAPDRLLVFDPVQGWEPLCKFLGVPAPASPFPWTNKGAEFFDHVRRSSIKSSS